MKLLQTLITTATQDEAELVAEQLRTFNRQRVPSMAFSPIWLVAKDEDGVVVGGFVGEVYLGWLEVAVLWVSETSRGRGLGRRLLQEAEALAVSMGASSAFLDTFSWQAEAFYARLGYSPFGRLDDFPTGGSRAFLKKRLSSPHPSPAS